MLSFDGWIFVANCVKPEMKSMASLMMVAEVVYNRNVELKLDMRQY